MVSCWPAHRAASDAEGGRARLMYRHSGDLPIIGAVLSSALDQLRHRLASLEQDNAASHGRVRELETKLARERAKDQLHHHQQQQRARDDDVTQRHEREGWEEKLGEERERREGERKRDCDCVREFVTLTPYAHTRHSPRNSCSAPQITNHATDPIPFVTLRYARRSSSGALCRPRHCGSFNSVTGPRTRDRSRRSALWT